MIGGALGACGIATRKKFYRSDFSNLDGVVTEEDRTTEVQVNLKAKRLLIAICIVIFLLGISLIERDHNWNPIQTREPVVRGRE